MSKGKLFRILILSINFFLILGLFNLGMATDGWKGELIDNTVNVIGKTSIALDSEGNPHIGYTFKIDDNKTGIKYAYFDGTKWIKTEIDTIGGRGTMSKSISIALDSDDNPHFVYNDSEYVYYTYFRGDTWVYYYISPELRNIGGVNCSSLEPLLSSRSIAIDEGMNGRVHIAYTGCRPDPLYFFALRTLYHVVFNGSNFDSYIRDQDEPQYGFGFRNMSNPGVLVLKNDDSAGIVYFKSGRDILSDAIDELKFSHIKGGEHHIETLKEINYPFGSSSPFSYRLAAVLDDANALSISYEFDAVLKYLRIYGLDGGVQTTEESDIKEGLWQSDYSIALDSNSDPHIAFTNTIDYTANDYLGYAWQYNNDWFTKILPPLGLGHFGAGVSMAIDIDNHKHISHIDMDTDALYYTHSCSDVDEDEVCDNIDNCPDDSNTSQHDNDGDGIGDTCDYCPNRPNNNNNNIDTDGDGIGDVCDNCKYVRNSNQEDADLDGVGNVCDNCADVPNGPKLGSCIPESYVGTSPKEPPSCQSFELEPCQESCFESAQEEIVICRKFQLPSQIEQCVNEVEATYYNCIEECDCFLADTYCSASQEDVNNNGKGDACEEWSPYSFGLRIEHKDTITLPETRIFTDSICFSNWCPSSTYSLVWGGSTMKLEIIAPGGKPFREITSPSGLIKIKVPNPKTGSWTAIVHAVADIPVNDPYPFTLKLESDRDEDGIVDSSDDCPSDPFNDSDQDGVCGDTDNCPTADNSNQYDFDNDGVGDKCDNCPFIENPAQIDSDGDDMGNLCDNCPKVYNPDQKECEAVSVLMNVRPGDCDSVINLKAKGVLPVAVLGGEYFDITQIEANSLKLEGISPLRVTFKDITQPGVCGEIPDGHLDLMMKFNRNDILNAIGGNDNTRKVSLSLTGNLKEEFGGDPIKGSQLIRLHFPSLRNTFK